jgi:glucose-1-phosphate thymidylyltransferase
MQNFTIPEITNNLNQSNVSYLEVVTIIPAAGMATSLTPLPCSKELIPIGFGAVEQEKKFRPKVISHYLFDMFKLAQIKKAYIMLNSEKLDMLG